MNNNVAKSMSASRRAFFELVVPPLQEFFGGGDVYPVEGMAGEFERKLDMEAGIDAVMFSPYGVYGIASRVQFDVNYRTFTIRKHRESGRTTEWKKLTAAIENDAMMPSLTVQAYADGNGSRLLGAAVVSTVDLVYWIEQHPCKTKRTGGFEKGQAEFWIVPWNDLRDNPEVRFMEFGGANII